MAFNLFGSLPKEDTGKKAGQNIMVLPVKNKNEKIKEKAASDVPTYAPKEEISEFIESEM